MPDKDRVKAIRKIAMNAPGCGTTCCEAMSYCIARILEPCFACLDAAPDMTEFFTGHYCTADILKDRDCPHLLRVLERLYNRAFGENQLLKQIL